MISIHLDDQMDSKSLLGAYMCTSKPGEFVWQPGPLAQAVVQGRWLVIENIDTAPPEVLASLIPLLESRTLQVPSRGEELLAAAGFQLFATITAAPSGGGGGAASSQRVHDLLGGLFHQVLVAAPSAAEQLQIAGHLHPGLKSLLPHAMAAISAVQVAHGQAPLEIGRLSSVAHALAGAGLRRGELSVGRHISIRDLLKWAGRMAAVHGPMLARSLKEAMVAEYMEDVALLPVGVREAAFVELADCLCSFTSSAATMEKLLQCIAAIWAVPPSTIAQYSSLAKPSMQEDEAGIAIGRARLASLDSRLARHQGRQPLSRFAFTGHAMRHMERVAVATACEEPVLLVGETGTGKTTLVQQIASRVGAKLMVLNLSQQTDSSDFLGGFRPMQPAQAVSPLLDEFIDLTRRTWWRGDNSEFLTRISKLAEKGKWGQVVKGFRAALNKVGREVSAAESNGSEGRESPADAKRKRRDRKGSPDASAPGGIQHEWSLFHEKVKVAEAVTQAAEGGFAFAFVEGILLQAVRQGCWLLLDEINLAPPEASLRDAECHPCFSKASILLLFPCIL
jgi:midasin